MLRFQNKESVFFSLQIVLPLLLGTLCYGFFRPDTSVSKLLFASLSFPVSLPSFLLDFFRGFLSDMLWAYSLTITVFWILRGFKRPFFLAGGISIVFLTFMELTQLFGMCSGTFDFWDIILEIIASATALTILKKHEKETLTP